MQPRPTDHVLGDRFVVGNHIGHAIDANRRIGSDRNIELRHQPVFHGLGCQIREVLTSDDAPLQQQLRLPYPQADASHTVSVYREESAVVPALYSPDPIPVPSGHTLFFHRGNRRTSVTIIRGHHTLHIVI